MILSLKIFSQKKEYNNSSSITYHESFNDTVDNEKQFKKKYSSVGRITFGLKAGYNHNNIYGSELNYMFANNQTQWLSGFHVGAQVNTQCNKYFWLKHELLFSTRGASVTLTDSINGNYTSKLKTYYLDLFPASTTFHVKGFQLYAGPYVSLLTSATIQRKDEKGNPVNDKTIYGDGSNNESERKYLQKFDFGIHAGIEYQFPFGLLIGAKYMNGFIDIFQYANSYTFQDTKTDRIKIYNQSVMISLGYSFCPKSAKKSK
jgi:hypothetical protein